ncbi:mucin-5AC-like [Hemibagrus wyckioides]|uniref:mucin-5AC-like n=1 Tax=Hemibagrus wyckioides TaxID=337641 RepID=UPI00266DBF81|nr:mucin-5AC-like [Hemibagrus wyckioides]
MLWQKTEKCFMILAVLMLTSSICCLEILPNGKSIRSGRLIIGSSRTTSPNKDDLKMLHDKYVGDSNGFQSDQPALMEGSELAMLKLQRLSPSVRCDNNSMSLHIQGSRVPNFLVETGKEGPVPLFQMPSNCGFSVKRARRDLALVANYDGCNVVQQGDAYILPLRYLGVGMKVVCPMARPLSTVFCSRSAMVVNLCPSLEGLWVKVNGLWQPVHQVATCGFTLKPVAGGLTLTAPYTSRCWQFERAERILSVKYSGVELTLSCPAVATLPAEGHPGTPTTTSTTMTTPASADQPQWYPWLHGMPYPYFKPGYFYHGHPGAPPVPPTTKAPTTTTVAPASADQPQWYPWLHGMQYPYFKPGYFYHGHPGAPPVPPTTKAPTTTSTTTTVAQASADQPQWYPWLNRMQYPYFKPGYFYHGHPGAPPVPHTTKAPTTTTTPAATTTTTTSASADQPQWYPWLYGMQYPYFKPWHFHHHHGAPPVPYTTKAPTTTTTPAASDSSNQQALYHWFPVQYHGMPWYAKAYSLPGAPTVTPPATPQTTTVTGPSMAATVAPSNSDQPQLYPWLPGMINPYVPAASADISVPAPNSGDTQQMSWVNAFPKFQSVVNPSNVVSYPAHFFPLQVKASAGK